MAAQQALQAEEWAEEIGVLRVRMAVHTGVSDLQDGDYFGQPLNRVSRLMAAGHCGQILLSHSTYELARDQLPTQIELRDLGEHRLKDLIRPEHVFQLNALDLPSQFPPLITLESRPNNLSAQLTPLIGRGKELAEIATLVRQHGAHLITLTGTGGTGKTRLGLQAGADLLDDFHDGVWLVELAALTDQSLVLPTIAQTLGLMEDGSKPLLDTLKDYLRSKELLLLLDNFEQVAGAASHLGVLLKAAPHIKVLVTSRVALRVYGEKEYQVPPLALPDAYHLPSLGRLNQYEAVRLFIERAQDVKPDFQVTNGTAPAVAQICTRLDGLPLAIELAAARIRLFPPEALLARLDSRLKLLTGGARDLPARQQTLRNTIEWSYSLLDDGEKQFFRRMAPFSGGRTLQALEAVCNYDGCLQVDLFDGAESLLSNSLLQQREGSDGDPRFWMLETIHEYAREKLQESGEAELLEKVHALYFMTRSEEAKLHLFGPKQQEWLDHLEDEHDNLRAALRWSEREGQGGSAEALETGLRLAANMGRFWEIRGYFTEGRDRLSALLSAARPAIGSGTVTAGGAADHADSGTALSPSEGMAGALNAAGQLAYRQGDYDAAQSLLEQALEVARVIGDKGGMALSSNNLGLLVHMKGGYEAARSHYENSLALYSEIGNKWGVALSLNYLGNVASQQGDHQLARSLHEQSLALRREIGDKRGIAQSITNLGMVAFFEEDYATSNFLYEQGVSLRKEIGDKWGLATALVNLGNVVFMQGDYPTSRSLHIQALALYRELGDKLSIAHCLAGLGEGLIESAQDGQNRQVGRGVRLLASSDANYDAIGAVMEADTRISYDRAVATARSRLGDDEFARLHGEGRTMSMEQAIAYALEEIDHADQ